MVQTNLPICDGNKTPLKNRKFFKGVLPFGS